MIKVLSATITCLKKSFNIKDRAGKEEFWWFTLFVYITTSIIVNFMPIWGAPLFIMLNVPQYTAAVRRLHDTNRSALDCVPYFGCLMMLCVLFPFMDSDFALLCMQIFTVWGFFSMFYLIYRCGQDRTSGPNCYGDPCPLL